MGELQNGCLLSVLDAFFSDSSLCCLLFQIERPSSWWKTIRDRFVTRRKCKIRKVKWERFHEMTFCPWLIQKSRHQTLKRKGSEGSNFCSSINGLSTLQVSLSVTKINSTWAIQLVSKAWGSVLTEEKRLEIKPRSSSLSLEMTTPISYPQSVIKKEEVCMRTRDTAQALFLPWSLRGTPQKS